ncbi:glycosyltransferase [soil metagenome]
MRILFASGTGYLPEFSGGVQSSTDHLIRQSLAQGHQAAVLAALFGDGMFGLKARAKLRLSGKPAVTDRILGYDVMRSWIPWETANYAVDSFEPDVALVQCHNAVPLGRALVDAGVPLVVYLRNVEFDELAGDPRDLRNALFIANSRFTAETYRAKFSIESVVIPPTIDRAQYAVETTREFVTFINPMPAKGFDLAVQIAAACPDIPFLFVESWSLTPADLDRITKAIGNLPNVTLQRRTSDMRSVYGRTRVLLAPSRWQEAWGRVASEAQCSGIPVVGSNRGGLPEAIGRGGVVLDYEAPVKAWTEVVQRLCADANYYETLSSAASTHADRDELRSDLQFEKFIAVLGAAARL